MVTQEDVKRYLQEHQMSQAALAKVVGITPAALSQWLHGKNKFAEDTLRRLERIVVQ
jgi:transcriptional regulator with XRE-family HTH domain